MSDKKNIKTISFLVEPFKAIGTNKLNFSYWFIFTIFSGQLGIIMNLLIRYYSQDISILCSLKMDYKEGNFYIFSIALIASMIGLLFIKFVELKDNNFNKIRITTVVVAIFVLLFAGIIYSALQIKPQYEFGFTQLVIYFFCIILSIYIYGLLNLNLPSNAEVSDEYLDQINDTMKANIENKSKNDGQGVHL